MSFKVRKVFVKNKKKTKYPDTNDVPKAEWIFCATARIAALDS